jgi:hypothetical protein
MLSDLKQRTGRGLMWCRKCPSWWVMLASHMANLRIPDQFEDHLRALDSEMTITTPQMTTQIVMVAFSQMPAY